MAMCGDQDDDQMAHFETTCGSLLLELKKIWDQVGEADAERDRMLFEIEEECLQVYKRKVGEANEFRAELKHEISSAQAEIESILSALGENSVKFECKVSGNLKEELETIRPRLEEMRRRKAEREKRFAEVMGEITSVSVEIFGSRGNAAYNSQVDGTDFSMKKLDQLRKLLSELQEEKSKRQKQVEGLLNNLRSICGVLGMDCKHTLSGIHSTLADPQGRKDITDDTIKKLVTAIDSLREVKIERIQRLQHLATVLLELWILLDSPTEEQQIFQNVIKNIAASEPEITEPNALSVDIIKQVEAEVAKLEKLKSSKIKELLLKRSLELEEICRKAHLVDAVLTTTIHSVESAVSGAADTMHLLEELDMEIAKAKAEAFSRKEILDKVEKWLAACEEECWLEEYNRDENRYTAGKGAHLTLKRAEKARVLANKLPAMVEALTLRIISWEEERGIDFLYDGERLLSRLEEYTRLRNDKENERQRQRDQKRLQVQLIAEQEAIYGSKPSPSKSGKKASGTPIGVASSRKLSLGGAMLQNLKAEKASSRVYPSKKGESLNENSSFAHQLHSGRRNSEVPGRIVKKKQSSVSTKQHETKSQLIRKPLSPIPPSLSKANIVNFPEEQMEIHSEALQTTLSCSKTPMRTPLKSISVGDEENRTPKAMPIPVPVTPATVSAPMLVSSTPPTPFVPSVIKRVKSIAHIEYSFEELRAGFRHS